MKRSTLLSLLQAYRPTAPEEIIARQTIIDFVNANSDCFERSLEIGHITGSAFVLNKDKTKALIMHHAKLNMWVQLGGHCDGDSDVLNVAIKEAQEESGIQGIAAASPAIFDIDVHLIPANSKEKEHYHYDVRFLLHVTSDEEVIQNRESKELRWVGPELDKLPTDSLSVVRMFKKWKSLSSSTSL